MRANIARATVTSWLRRFVTAEDRSAGRVCERGGFRGKTMRRRENSHRPGKRSGVLAAPCAYTRLRAHADGCPMPECVGCDRGGGACRRGHAVTPTHRRTPLCTIDYRAAALFVERWLMARVSTCLQLLCSDIASHSTCGGNGSGSGSPFDEEHACLWFAGTIRHVHTCACALHVFAYNNARIPLRRTSNRTLHLGIG